MNGVKDKWREVELLCQKVLSKKISWRSKVSMANKTNLVEAGRLLPLASWSKSSRWPATLPTIISVFWNGSSVLTATAYWGKHHQVDAFVFHGILKILEEPKGSPCLFFPGVVKLHEAAGFPIRCTSSHRWADMPRPTSRLFFTVLRVLMFPWRTENETYAGRVQGSW